MSFYGFDCDVYNVMQKLSHQTRAYIINGKGLKGLLKTFDLIRFLEYVGGERFEEAVRFQYVDMSYII